MINFKLRIPLFDRTESVQFTILGSFSGEGKLNFCNSEYVFSGPMGILKTKFLILFHSPCFLRSLLFKT